MQAGFPRNNPKITLDIRPGSGIEFVTVMANKRTQTTTKVFSLRLPMSLLQRLKKLAKTQRRTTAGMARLLLEEALNGK